MTFVFVSFVIPHKYRKQAVTFFLIKRHSRFRLLIDFVLPPPAEFVKVTIFTVQTSEVFSRARSYLGRLKECASAYLYHSSLPPSRRPPATLSLSSLPCGHCVGALQCHRYDRPTLSAQEIPLFVCSPPKGVKLSS